MARNEPTLARRSSLRADLRIILLGTWAFVLQLVHSLRWTPQLLNGHDDSHD